MLPEAEALGSSSARYGAYAMEVLINELLKRGARRERLEAKVFGGGNVIKGMTVANVGARNASFALRYLEDELIRILAQDLGGIDASKLGYFPRSGRVLLKHLPVAATEIGRASCRESVCQYVEIAGGAGSLKKTT